MAAPSLSSRVLDPSRERIARAALVAVQHCENEVQVLRALCLTFRDYPLGEIRTSLLGAAVNVAFDPRERLILSRTAAAMARAIDLIPMRLFDPADPA